MDFILFLDFIFILFILDLDCHAWKSHVTWSYNVEKVIENSRINNII